MIAECGNKRAVM